MPKLKGQKNINNEVFSQPLISLGGGFLIPNIRIKGLLPNLGASTLTFLNFSSPPFIKKKVQVQSFIEFAVLADNVLPNITVDTTKTFTNNTNVTADRT